MGNGILVLIEHQDGRPRKTALELLSKAVALNIGPVSAAVLGAPGTDMTATLASLVRAEADPGRARLVWEVSTMRPVTVYRRTLSTSWEALGAFRLFTGIQADAIRMEAHFRRMAE